MQRKLSVIAVPSFEPLSTSYVYSRYATGWSGVCHPSDRKLNSTIRRALPTDHSSKNICDFCPVVPEEVAVTVTAERGTESSSCCLKNSAGIMGSRAQSATVRRDAGSKPRARQTAA